MVCVMGGGLLLHEVEEHAVAQPREGRVRGHGEEYAHEYLEEPARSVEAAHEQQPRHDLVRARARARVRARARARARAGARGLGLGLE